MTMRKILAILICTCYLAGSSVSFIPPLYYFFNKTYIAENLCENKDKVELHCEGKCFVAKEVIKLNEEKQNTDKPHHQSQQQEIFPHESAAGISVSCFEETKLLIPFNQPTYPLSPYRNTVHLPPEFLG